RQASYDLGHPTDDQQVLALLHGLERRQVASYLDAVPRLEPGPVRAAAATILTSDAQHIALLRMAQGMVPAPTAFVTGNEWGGVPPPPPRRELLAAGAGAAAAATVLGSGRARAATGTTTAAADGGPPESDSSRIYRLLSAELLVLFTY